MATLAWAKGAVPCSNNPFSWLSKVLLQNVGQRSGRTTLVTWPIAKGLTLSTSTTPFKNYKHKRDLF